MSLKAVMMQVMAEQGLIEEREEPRVSATTVLMEMVEQRYGPFNHASMRTVIDKAVRDREIENLVYGKHTIMLMITDWGRDYVRKITEEDLTITSKRGPAKKKQEKEVTVQVETIPVAVKMSPIEIFEKAIEAAAEIVDVLKEYEGLALEVGHLREENAKLAKRHDQLVEEKISLRRQLEKVQTEPRKTLRVDQVPKWCRELAKLALEQGWSIKFTGSNHIMWIPPNGAEPYVSSNTPSDHRTLANTKAALQQRGLTT